MSFFSKETFKSLQLKGTGFTQGVKIGYDLGFRGGLPFAIGGAAISAMSAPTGHALSKSIAAGTSSSVLAMAGAIAGTMLGGPIGGYVGSFAAMLLGGEATDKAVSNGIQSLVDFGSNMRKVRFGGDYRDTQMALTMRQVAAREMSRSLVNARQYLGLEGAFLHQ